MTARAVVTWLQAASFVVLAVILVRSGEPRLAAAQIMLAAITVLIYL